MPSGFFLGGAAEGINQAQQAATNQQRVDQTGFYERGMLQLEQQKLQHMQERELFARADKDVASLIETAKEADDAMLAAGKSPAERARALQPLLQPAKRLMKSAGRDDSQLDAQVSLWLARPALPPIDQGAAPSPQVATTPQVPSGTPAAPGQDNLTSPTEVPGSFRVSEGPVETRNAQGLPVASAASSRTQPADEVAYLTRLLETTPKEMTSRRAAIEIRLRNALAAEKPEIKTVTGLGGQQEMKAVYPRSGKVVDIVDNTMAGQERQRVKSAFEADLHGNDFLKALPAEDRNFVKGVATYKINPATSSVRGGRRETLMSWVTQYNPEYDQSVFTSKNRAMQTVGQREGQIVGALENAKATAPIVVQMSESVPRTQFPTINSLILAAEQGTGGENVVRYGVAINTLINNYARALGAGTAVLTDSARKEATEILQKAWSQGQIKAGVNQMLIEIERELTGTKTALKTVRQQFGEDETSSPATKSETPKIHNALEYFK